MYNLLRSIIFVPGNNKRFLDKARALQADIICLDLEDSVPPEEKGNARDMIASSLDSGGFSSSVYVRTNSPASGLLEADLGAVTRPGLEGIVVPKVNRPVDLDTIQTLAPNIGIIPSIESALGVVNCYPIATYNSMIRALVFGIFDLLHDMGIEYSAQTAATAYGRTKVPLDAAAAGIPAIDGVWQDIRDAGGFRNDCMLGRRLGYAGKSLIHPDQVGIAHDIFAPTTPELDWARRVRDTYENTRAGGRGATTLDGKMIDEVHYKRALAVLDVAGKAKS